LKNSHSTTKIAAKKDTSLQYEEQDTVNEDEMKIISQLHYNSNENFKTIAKQCGFSQQKTWRIIKQMENRGIVWGYTAITDMMRLNRKQYIMLIKRTNKPLDKKMIEKINSMQLEDFVLPLGLHIESSYFVHGTYDWIIVFTAQDIKQAKKFSGVLHTEFPNVIEQNDIQQILYCFREHYIFNPNRKNLKELME
jgi:DNA-binding Lrp family transcriptional regulator